MKNYITSNTPRTNSLCVYFKKLFWQRFKPNSRFDLIFFCQYNALLCYEATGFRSAMHFLNIVQIMPSVVKKTLSGSQETSSQFRRATRNEVITKKGHNALVIAKQKRN